jgi:hypothetical protein
MRHKGFHIVNVHKSLSLLSDFIMSHMGDKLRKRTQIYTSFDEFKAVERKNLPKEYGGTVPMKTMIGEPLLVQLSREFKVIIFLISLAESLKKELSESRHLHMLLTETRVNTNMYPKAVLEGSVKSLKYLLNSSEIHEKFKNHDIYGLQGSFRKLEID